MNIAVIGAGYWGVNLIRVFSQLDVLHTICDFSPERLQQLAAKYPSAVNWKHLLRRFSNDPAVDAVVIATPAERHYAMARTALLAGKDVFVEKPLTLHCQEAENILSSMERGGEVLMVGHLLEYHPAVTRLQEMIEAGELGKLEYIYSNRLNMGKVRREENALWSFAPHDISVILLLLNQMPIQN